MLTHSHHEIVIFVVSIKSKYYEKLFKQSIRYLKFFSVFNQTNLF